MLEARELMVFYENMLALNNITLTCPDDGVIGIFGANSAGKSTLMYALSGIILDIEHKEKMRGGERLTILGDVILNGENVSKLKTHHRARKGMVLCPERRRLFPESSVQENLAIGGHLATKAEAKETFGFVMELFPALKALRKRSAGFLSGGEQQMVAIGRSLMAQPSLLLLDEPLLGLAPSIQHIVVESIPHIRKERGISVVVSEQYARPVIPYVDYAYILENGSTVMEGTREELLDNPDIKAAYFGY